MCVRMKKNDVKLPKEQGGQWEMREVRERGVRSCGQCSPVYILSEKIKNNKIKILDITMPFSA